MSKARELAELGAVYDSGALSNRNMVINGAMQVAQRGTSSAGLGASSGYFTVDRFNPNFNATAGRLTMTQETITDLPGFNKCVKFACTTADTSISAAEYFILSHNIEGQNLQQLAKGTSSAKKVTVSFYVKGNAAATYVCELQDQNSREISKSFSVTTDWTRVVLTFDGDTSGTITNTNTTGMGLIFWLHAGSNFNSGNAGDLNTSWSAAGTGTRAAGAGSFFDSTSRTFFITGVQMELGSEATPFEHRSFGQELALCERYFQKYNYSSDVSTADTQNTLPLVAAYAGDTGYAGHKLTATMRTSPSFSASAANTWQFYSGGTSLAASEMTAYETGPSMWGQKYVATSNFTSGYAVYGRALTTSSYYQFDAEL